MMLWLTDMLKSITLNFVFKNKRYLNLAYLLSNCKGWLLSFFHPSILGDKRCTMCCLKILYLYFLIFFEEVSFVFSPSRLRGETEKPGITGSMSLLTTRWCCTSEASTVTCIRKWSKGRMTTEPHWTYNSCNRSTNYFYSSYKYTYTLIPHFNRPCCNRY